MWFMARITGEKIMVDETTLKLFQDFCLSCSSEGKNQEKDQYWFADLLSRIDQKYCLLSLLCSHP